jgi:DNA-directed RNA polymerase subunit RPC12/RpoP
VIRPAEQIVCVDCGGRCFLLTHPPEDGIWEAGEFVAYRCEDCLDRWDLELTEDDDDESGRGDAPDRSSTW